MSDNKDLLLVEEKNNAVILTMNRPEVMNSLNFGLLYAIRDQIDSLQYKSAVRCVIITGAGDKSFCAGADLKERATLSPDEVKKFIAKIQEDIGDEFEADKLKEHLSLEDKDSNIVEIFEETKKSLNEIKKDSDNKNT
jgi:enoyl-CoA hydratase/carnithine racemase